MSRGFFFMGIAFIGHRYTINVVLPTAPVKPQGLADWQRRREFVLCFGEDMTDVCRLHAHAIVRQQKALRALYKPFLFAPIDTFFIFL